MMTQSFEEKWIESGKQHTRIEKGLDAMLLKISLGVEHHSVVTSSGEDIAPHLAGNTAIIYRVNIENM